MVDKRKAVANTLSQMDIPGKTDRPKKMIDDATKMSNKEVSRTITKRSNVDDGEDAVRGSVTGKDNMVSRLNEQAYKVKKKYDPIGASNPPNGPKKRYDK